MPSGPIQPTRVQIDIFELRCPSDRLAKLDLATLADGNPPDAEVIKRLGALGSARLLARIDDTTDLLTESNLSREANVPVVQGVTAPTSGPSVQSVSYASVGLTMSVSGAWQEDEPGQAVVKCKLELSTVAASSVEASPGLKMPAFVKVKIEQDLVADSGRPVWALSNSLPASQDPEGLTSAAIARLTFTRLPSLSEPEPMGDDQKGASSSDEQDENVYLLIDLFELSCTSDRLAELSLDDLTRDDPADGALLSRLKKSGAAKLLSRMQNTFDMSEQNRLSHGTQVPIVSNLVTTADGKMVPSITYQDIGFVAGMLGRWVQAGSPWADARIDISASMVNQSQVRNPSGLALPSSGKFGLKQRIGTLSGRPVWTMSSSLSDAADDTGMTNVILMRVKPTLIPGPTLSAAEEERAAEAPYQAEKPQPARLCVDVFDLACTDEQLAGLDFDKLTAGEPTAEAVLERLQAQGQTRLLARVEDTVDLRKGLSLSQSLQMPQVSSLTVEKGTVKPSVNYRKVGLSTHLNGEWLPGVASWADLYSKLEMSADARSQVKKASEMIAPIFVNFSIEQKQLLESGKSLWVISNRLPQPDDPTGQVNVKIVRLKASHESASTGR